MRIASVFATAIMLLFAGILGPTACNAPKLSKISASSVRVRSIVKKTSRRRSGGVYIGGSGYSSRSSRSGSSRYSSGGGFSSGK